MNRSRMGKLVLSCALLALFVTIQASREKKLNGKLKPHAALAVP